MPAIQRPDPSEYNPHYHNEISSVPDAPDFGELLRQQVRETASFMHAGIRRGARGRAIRAGQVDCS